MKKLFISLLLILQIVFLFTACSDSTAAAARILEISSASLSAVSKDANHTNEIDSETKITTDAEAASKNSIQLGELTLPLQYKETNHENWGINSIFKRHVYMVPESEMQNFKISGIQLYSNGEVQIIGANYNDTICIIDEYTPQISKEDIIRLVQERFAQYIDFNRYQYVNVDKSSAGACRIYWYNMVEGIPTDFCDRLLISIASDGRINMFRFPPSTPVISLEQYEEGFKKCPKSTHDALIKAKLDQIYKTDKTDYNEDNYNIPDDYVQLTVYDGKPAVIYAVEVYVKRSSHADYYGEIARILIVLE